MRVPFVDLRPQHRDLYAEFEQVFRSFLDEPRFILGAPVAHFEQEFAQWLGVPHAIGVSSGTDALLCSLLALGVGPGDEVITTPFSFVATAEAIARVGAVPKFVDIEPATLNIDPQCIERALTKRTRAVIPVHLFGCPAEMRSILSIAEKHGLAVVEDAAQALGAEYRGAKVGSFGALAAFSFFPSKPLGGFGDGGMIATKDAQLAERCRHLRSHGRGASGQVQLQGGNFRLDALQAALLSVKLPQVDRWNRERREIAERYARAFGELSNLALPACPDAVSGVFSLYTLRVRPRAAASPAQENPRDRLRGVLRERGIETAIYYPQPLHWEPVFQAAAPAPGALPVAEQAALEVLSLPIYPGLSPEQQQQVIDTVVGFAERS